MRTIYNSRQDRVRDEAGTAVRFVMPMVMNGRVYLGLKGQVDVYGLLPATKKP